MTRDDDDGLQPSHACDCHIHIYDDAYPLAPTATTPSTTTTTTASGAAR